MEIRIHYTWFIIFFLVTWSLAVGYIPGQFPNLDPIFYWIIGAISSFALFASVLLHELAHSYVALKQGISVSSITLFIFGGVSQIVEEPSSPKNEAKMAAVGPLSSFAIASVFAVLWVTADMFKWGPFLIAPFSYIAVINALLGGFNLLPAFPLDGGRVLRAGIWRWKQNLIKATKLSSKISDGIAYALIALGVASIFLVSLITGIWLVFIGWFLKSGSESALKQTIVSQALSELEVKEIMNSQVIAVSSDLTIAEISEEYFGKNKHGGYPIVDNQGKVLGIITKQDLEKVDPNDLERLQVKEVMTPEEKIISLSPDEPAVEALIKFSKYDIGRLIVVDEGKLLGIITRSDLVRALKNRVKTDNEIEEEIQV